MSKTQFRPKVEVEPYNSKLTKCYASLCCNKSHQCNKQFSLTHKHLPQNKTAAYVGAETHLFQACFVRPGYLFF